MKNGWQIYIYLAIEKYICIKSQIVHQVNPLVKQKYLIMEKGTGKNNPKGAVNGKLNVRTKTQKKQHSHKLTSNVLPKCKIKWENLFYYIIPE